MSHRSKNEIEEEKVWRMFNGYLSLDYVGKVYVGA